MAADTLAQAGLGTSPVITAQADATVAMAIDVLLDNRISSVPIVDSEGRLQNVYARTDIRHMALSQNYNLDMTVTEAVQHRACDVYRCRAEIETVGAVADVLAQGSFRRVFCVDDKDIVQGIVSLSDLFRFITGREDLEPAPESTM